MFYKRSNSFAAARVPTSFICQFKSRRTLEEQEHFALAFVRILISQLTIAVLYKVIRIPESRKFCLRNPESLALESRIQLKESGIHKVQSRIQDCPWTTIH